MVGNVYHGWNHLQCHWILLVLVVHQHHCSYHSSEVEQLAPELLAAGCTGNIARLKGWCYFMHSKTSIFHHLSEHLVIIQSSSLQYTKLVITLVMKLYFRKTDLNIYRNLQNIANLTIR